MLFYSVFQAFHRKKNDSFKVLMSLNPEGPLGSYLCDVLLPVLLITCQFLFCRQEQRILYWVKKICIFFLFSGLIFLILVFLMFLYYSFRQISYIIFCSFSIACYSCLLVHVIRFSDFSCRLFVAFVGILKCLICCYDPSSVKL